MPIIFNINMQKSSKTKQKRFCTKNCRS